MKFLKRIQSTLDPVTILLSSCFGWLLGRTIAYIYLDFKQKKADREWQKVNRDYFNWYKDEEE